MTLETFFEQFELLADAPNGVQKLRELILRLAVQGKLVPQNSNDEPAYKQIKSIQNKKQKLSIEKQQKLLEFTEIPYDIPENWQWVRVLDIITLKSGNTLEASLELDQGDALYIKVGDMNLPGNEKEILSR